MQTAKNNNQVYQNRLLPEQDFNLFEDKDPQVILVKHPSPSKSPTVRPGVANALASQGQFLRPSGSRSNGAKNFPTPKGLITGKLGIVANRQQTRLEGAGNPAGAGGGASSDDLD